MGNTDMLNEVAGTSCTPLVSQLVKHTTCIGTMACDSALEVVTGISNIVLLAMSALDLLCIQHKVPDIPPADVTSSDAATSKAAATAATAQIALPMPAAGI